MDIAILGSWIFVESVDSLKALTNDIDMFGAMLDGVARMAGLITHYAIFECLYLQGEYMTQY